VWVIAWGLSCLWKAIVMALLHISLEIDNLDSCKENEKCVETLVDFQFIRNVIRWITVIVKSQYCYQLPT
jgi:hypothetical protein